MPLSLLSSQLCSPPGSQASPSPQSQLELWCQLQLCPSQPPVSSHATSTASISVLPVLKRRRPESQRLLPWSSNLGRSSSFWLSQPIHLPIICNFLVASG